MNDKELIEDEREALTSIIDRVDDKDWGNIFPQERDEIVEEIVAAGFSRVAVPDAPGVDAVLNRLDELNNGGISYEIYSELHDLVSAIPAAVPDAATERVTENSVRHVKRLTTELQNRRESLNDQRREFRKLLAAARAERDAARAAIARVRELEIFSITYSYPAWTAVDHDDLLAALDGAPEPEVKP